MKFKNGESVIILDEKENKPAYSGKIVSYDSSTNLYKVKFSYQGSTQVEEINLTESKLISAKDIATGK
jgi:hypothetical protein